MACGCQPRRVTPLQEPRSALLTKAMGVTSAGGQPRPQLQPRRTQDTDEPVPARQAWLAGGTLERIGSDSAKPCALRSRFYCKGLRGFALLSSSCEQPGPAFLWARGASPPAFLPFSRAASPPLLPRGRTLPSARPYPVLLPSTAGLCQIRPAAGGGEGTAKAGGLERQRG